MSSYCISSRLTHPICRDVTKRLEIKKHLELVWFCLREGNSPHRGDSQSSSSCLMMAWEKKPGSFGLWESDRKHNESNKQFLLYLKRIWKRLKHQDEEGLASDFDRIQSLMKLRSAFLLLFNCTKPVLPHPDLVLVICFTGWILQKLF